MNNNSLLSMLEDVEDESLYTQALLRFADQLDNYVDKSQELPADWLEKHFWIPRPWNVETGEMLPPGPVRLSSIQKRVINEALRKDTRGLYVYSTVIYSATKKSGKSALTSGVNLYVAEQTPYGRLYCLANDGRQASDRLYGPIRDCIRLHNQHGGIFKGLNPTILGVDFRNFARIEPIPCDARGEAGSEPTMVSFSEFWGWDTDEKRRLYSEMTLPPTLYGKAIRWIESYAGFKGQSELLWEMYALATINGIPHPSFTDLVGRDGEPVVWINPEARLFCYWDTVPRMIWQNDEYYKEEALILDDTEFQRIHQNQWVSPIGSFIRGELWDACADTTILPLLEGSRTPVVLAIDAAISGDCASVVAVTRDPVYPETDVAVRGCWVFKPQHGEINLEETVGKTIRECKARWNVVCIAYDTYQMEKLAQDYRQGKLYIPPDEVRGMTSEERQEYTKQQQKLIRGWYFPFGQQTPRAIADKQLYDRIINRQIHWNPNDRDSDIPELGDKETLTKHIKQAGAKTDGNRNQRRIEKLSNEAKIDAAVALSMAAYVCMQLNIDNRETETDDIIKQLQRGEITYEEFQTRMAQRRAKVVKHG